MLNAPERVQTAVQRLAGTPEMQILNEWVQQEVASATKQLINESDMGHLSVLQNTVRVLTRMSVILSGGGKT